MLKKRQVIRWKEAVGGNQYRYNDGKKRMAIMSETFLVVVCTIMFMLSSRIMLSDVFEWGEFSGSFVFVAFILITIVCAVMEASYHVENQYGIYIRFGVLLSGIVLAVLYLWMDNDGEIASGLNQAGEQYMVCWNKYYGFAVSQVGDKTGNIEAGLNFIFLSISFLLLWIAGMTRKNIVLVVSPIIVLCMELLVGYAPKDLGIFFLFIGVLVSNASRWTKSDFVCSYGSRHHNAGMFKQFMWVAIGVGVICFYSIVKLVAGSSAEDIAEHGNEFKKIQEDIVADVTNWSVWELFGAVPDSGIISGDWGTNDSYKDKLTNRPLKYNNETVLTIEVYDKLHKNLYLRGYYANTYKDSVWELDYEEFEDACDEQGYDAQEMSEKILSLSSSKVEHLSDNHWYYATVNYVNTGNERAFYPYFIRFSDKDNVFSEGDGRYKKDEDTDRLSFYMWNQAYYYEYYLDTFEDMQKYDWEEWYEEYVTEHYTQVPKNMSNVDKIASIVSDNGKFYSSDNVNAKRMDIVENLVKWFKSNTAYSKEPPTLPTGEDPVEYFLGTSRTGYCMHYATSAVLILRTLGVPARYATGYVVDASSFEQVNSKYVADVLDSRAHAWVEIYLNGMGWVPVEVTNSYDSTNLDHIGEKENNVNEDMTDDENSDEDAMSTEEITSDEAITTQPEKEDESGDNEILSDGNVGSDDDNKKGTAATNSGNGVFKIIIIGIFIATAVAGSVYVVMRKKFLYNEQLLYEIKRKRTVRAIKRINRRIYFKVCVDRKILKTNLRDNEYANILKKTYTDITEKEWGRFMVVVKAAAFSDIDLPEKEMDFCYDVYKRVMKKD